MADKQTTAVEWLAEQIECLNMEEFWAKWGEFKQQALTMERNQIQDAYSTPLLKVSAELHDYGLQYLSDSNEAVEEAEQYYTDTYGK